MNKYEVLYIIDASADDATKEAQIAKYSDLVTAAGGIVCGNAAILAEGDAQDRADLVYLEKLPLFNADGTIK